MTIYRSAVTAVRMGSADDGPNFSSRVAEFIQSIDDPGSVSQDQAELDAVLMSVSDLATLDAAYGAGNKYTAAALAIQRQASVQEADGSSHVDATTAAAARLQMTFAFANAGIAAAALWYYQRTKKNWAGVVGILELGSTAFNIYNYTALKSGRPVFWAR